jgi:23S rRNA (cytidine1920-2'-O)/16S rRNA (cytidine1409-2'-O)-methyltransferase
MDFVRLDRLLVERGLIASRPRAEWLIVEHGVKVNGKDIRKPGKKVDPNATLELLGEDHPWVSRGALKLMAALDHFKVAVSGDNVLDLGASTGGFTEVCLNRGASMVHAVDVGTNQLVEALRNHPLVRDLQQTHLKDLSPSDLVPAPNAVVIDLSFISLAHVWPRMKSWLAPSGWGIALIKPQFEVGPKHLGRNGIVRDPSIRQKSVTRCIAQAEAEGFHCSLPMNSPIEGKSGNREFLVHFTWDDSTEPLLRTAVPEE